MSKRRTWKLVIKIHILMTLYIYFSYTYEDAKINKNIK